MAKSNLLKTEDKTFLDIVGNGRIYRVPAFQRDYSWEEEQWEDLWNDIQELTASVDKRHYMGALVVEAKSDREFDIIDGQQRIATLSVLALAIIHLLQCLGETDAELAANADRANRLRSRFIGEKDPASLVESSKLFLNETDDAFYQDYLVQLRKPNNPRGLPRSNRQLLNCFEWFCRHLEKEKMDGVSLAKLLSETVARQLLFILITVEDEISAYVVFETLNARGLELSSTDLLKNYLFSRVNVKLDLAALQRRWKAMISSVKAERFPDFLRYHLLCDAPRIRKQRLFKQVREQVRSGADVFALMDSLERRADRFAALNDSEHEFWLDIPDAKASIREFRLFKVGQMTPLLFAAWEKLDGQDFVKILRMVSVISFRYTVVCRLNTNELEPAYHFAAKALLSGVAKTPAEVFAKLKSVYVADEKFTHDFSMLELDTAGQRKKLVKYILCKLESDVDGIPRDFEADAGTIEHILPENPTAEWDVSFSADRQKDFIYRLGNLTLLEARLNRRIGNGLFADKLQSYGQSGYALVKKLVDESPEEWTPAALTERQKRLAQRATHLWRVNY